MEHIGSSSIIKGFQEIAIPHMQLLQDATDVFPVCNPVQSYRLPLRDIFRIPCLYLVHLKFELVGLMLFTCCPPSNFKESRRAEKLAIYKNITIVNANIIFGFLIAVAHFSVGVSVVHSLQNTRATPAAILQPHISTLGNEVGACHIIVFL